MNFFVDALALHLRSGQLGGRDRHRPAAGRAPAVSPALSVVSRLLIAVPLGLLIGHTGRGRGVRHRAHRRGPRAAHVRLLLLVHRSCSAGLGLAPLIVVLVVLAIPPLLAGVVRGHRGRRPPDRSTPRVRSGMTEWQILTRSSCRSALPLHGRRAALGDPAGGRDRDDRRPTSRRAASAATSSRGSRAATTPSPSSARSSSPPSPSSSTRCSPIVQKLVAPRGVSRGPARPTSRPESGEPSRSLRGNPDTHHGRIVRHVHTQDAHPRGASQHWVSPRALAACASGDPLDNGDDAAMATSRRSRSASQGFPRERHPGADLRPGARRERLRGQLRRGRSARERRSSPRCRTDRST